MNTVGHIRKAIYDVTDCRRQINEDTDLVMDLGLDSLDITEVTTVLGIGFNIPDKAWEDFFAPIIMAGFIGDGDSSITVKKIADFLDGHQRSHS